MPKSRKKQSRKRINFNLGKRVNFNLGKQVKQDKRVKQDHLSHLDKQVKYL